MKILVTGADGFIGSHLTEELVRRGYDVKAFCLYNSLGSWGWLDHCNKEVRNQFEVFSGDIRDPNGVRSAIAGCNAVMHLAALIAIPYSYHSPDTYVDTNVKGTLNVLQACRDQGIQRLIHTSTSEVYGTARFVPITEDHPLQGQSPYSATKIAADQLANSFYTSFELPVVTVRPFNTYGPRQSSRAIIPTIITQAIGQSKEIKLGSVAPTRDFNYVSDTVSGFIAALNARNVEGEIFNIGSNFEVSIGKTVELIMEIMGCDIEVISEDIRLRPKKSEVERLWSDNSKAIERLNWSPEYSGQDGFKKGLVKTIEWFSDPDNLIKYKLDQYIL